MTEIHGSVWGVRDRLVMTAPGLYHREAEFLAGRARGFGVDESACAADGLLPLDKSFYLSGPLLPNEQNEDTTIFPFKASSQKSSFKKHVTKRKKRF